MMALLRKIVPRAREDADVEGVSKSEDRRRGVLTAYGGTVNEELLHLVNSRVKYSLTVVGVQLFKGRTRVDNHHKSCPDSLAFAVSVGCCAEGLVSRGLLDVIN
jgi:hypothetical protein